MRLTARVEFRAQLGTGALERKVRAVRPERDNVRRVEALWRRKAWTRACRAGSPTPHLTKAAARRPSVGDGAQNSRRRRIAASSVGEAQRSCRDGPHNPAEAGALRQELEHATVHARATAPW